MGTELHSGRVSKGAPGHGMKEAMVSTLTSAGEKSIVHLETSGRERDKL